MEFPFRLGSFLAILLLGLVVGASLPSLFLVDFLEALLEKQASPEAVREMVKPMVDMKEAVPMESVRSSLEAIQLPGAAWNKE